MLLPSYNALMIEATRGNNKDHVYDFGSNTGAIARESNNVSLSSMPFISSITVHDCYHERDKKKMDYMQHAQGTFSTYMKNFAKKVGIEHDPVPTLCPFPPMKDVLFDTAIDDPHVGNYAEKDLYLM